MNGISWKPSDGAIPATGGAWRHAEAIFVAVTGPGRQFRFTELNAAAERALGLSAQILRQFRFGDEIEKSLFGKQQTAPFLYDRKVAPRCALDYFLKCLEGALHVDFEGDINLQPDGIDRIFRVNLIPLIEAGAVTHIIGFARETGKSAHVGGH